jgi:predicted nucleic acid-binding protein
MRQTIDSSVIVKGILKPMRKKQDKILEEQTRLYGIASSIMDEINKGENELVIPNVAIVEVAAVVSRLTGIKDSGIHTANLITSIAVVINESDVLKECIDIAAETKISGFDSIFIACAKAANSVLITDGRKMHEAATKAVVKSKLLRNMA